MMENVTQAIKVAKEMVSDKARETDSEYKAWQHFREVPLPVLELGGGMELAFEVPPKKQEMVVKVIGFKSPIDLITRDLIIGTIVLINMEPTFVPDAKKYGDFEKAMGAMADIIEPLHERQARWAARPPLARPPLDVEAFKHSPRELAEREAMEPYLPRAKCGKCGWRLVADGRGGMYCQKCEAGGNTLAAIADTLRGEASDAAKYDRLAQQAAKESDEAEGKGNPELSKELTVASRMFSAIARDEVKHKGWLEGMALKIRGAQRSR